MSNYLSDLGRARGALLGLAAGNAGFTTHCALPGSVNRAGNDGGRRQAATHPGQWSADTSMALCIAESLAIRGGQDSVDQMRRWLRWWRTGHFAAAGRCVGISTEMQRQLQHFEASGLAVTAEDSDLVVENASLSRAAPIAIRWATDIGQAASEAATASKTTHPGRRSRDTCSLLSAMIAAFIKGQTREQVFHEHFWAFGELHESCIAITRGSWRGDFALDGDGGGCCVTALKAAVRAVAASTDFSDAVLRASYSSDHADTMAAIAGSLAGAVYGESQIPEEWLAKLSLRDRIVSLADALHRAANSHRLRWHHDAILHAWWVDREGLVLAGEYPGYGENSPARRESLLQLADANVRLIIDLTNAEDDLPLYINDLKSILAEGDVHLRRLSRPLSIGRFPDDHTYDQIISDIRSVVTAGKRVYVHCSTGVERAAVVAAIWHAANGCEMTEAFENVRMARVGTRKENVAIPEGSEFLTGVARAVRRTRFPNKTVVTTTSREVRCSPCVACAETGGVYSQFDDRCHQCAGEGWRVISGRMEELCERCKGFGVTAVTQCDPCKECGGKGHHVLLFETACTETTVTNRCDICGGHGFKRVKRRVDQEDCERCDGSGVDFKGNYDRCPDCLGGDRAWGLRRVEEECKECDGSGERVEKYSSSDSFFVSSTELARQADGSRESRRGRETRP